VDNSITVICEACDFSHPLERQQTLKGGPRRLVCRGCEAVLEVIVPALTVQPVGPRAKGKR
jgi:hypothetical protein